MESRDAPWMRAMERLLDAGPTDVGPYMTLMTRAAPAEWS
jgi:hypothetical protein